MNAQPQANRQQRRAQAKASKGRIRKMNQSQYHAYQARARLWAKGCTATGRHIGDEFEGEWTFPAHVPNDKRESVAEYATHAPLRWHVTARCVCKADDGSQYIAEREAECGQVATPFELHDLRNELMQRCHDDVNVRHIWDEVYVMECLG